MSKVMFLSEFVRYVFKCLLHAYVRAYVYEGVKRAETRFDDRFGVNGCSPKATALKRRDGLVCVRACIRVCTHRKTLIS